MYDMFHVTPVPVYDHDDIFVSIKVNCHRCRQTYVHHLEKGERGYIKVNSDYLCERNYLVRRINKNSICKIQIYLNEKDTL